MKQVWLVRTDNQMLVYLLSEADMAKALGAVSNITRVVELTSVLKEQE